MDLPTIEADLALAATVAKLAVQVYEDLAAVAPFVEAIYQIAVGNQALTADQRSALVQEEANLRAQIAAPNPADAP